MGLIDNTDSVKQAPSFRRDLEWLARRREHLALARASLPREPATETPNIDAAIPGRHRVKPSAATSDSRTLTSRPSPGRRSLASRADNAPVQPVELRLSDAFGACDCGCGGKAHINTDLARPWAKSSAATPDTKAYASRPPPRQQNALRPPIGTRTMRGA